MGQRGPKPTPTKLLSIRGSWRAKTRQAGEPSVELGIPTRPDYLDADERKLWTVLLTRLNRAGLVTKVDGEVLARYCVLRTRWLKAVAFVRQHGDTYPIKDAAGRVLSIQTFPQAWMVSKLHADLLRIEREFGLTPSARATLGAVASGKPQTDTPASKGRFFKTG